MTKSCVTCSKHESPPRHEYLSISESEYEKRNQEIEHRNRSQLPQKIDDRFAVDGIDPSRKVMALKGNHRLAHNRKSCELLRVQSVMKNG
jgi:hypothetical protein